METLGVVETKGLVEALEAADAMVKTAQGTLPAKASVSAGGRARPTSRGLLHCSQTPLL
jgi:microcompartment protein CcmL/EutN